MSKKNDNYSLSAKEKRIVEEIMEGKTAKEIGEKLNISPRTVEARLQNIRTRFKCRTTLQLVLHLLELDLVDIAIYRYLREFFEKISKFTVYGDCCKRDNTVLSKIDGGDT